MTRWQFLAVMVAIVIIVPTFIYLSYSRESSAFAVDGDFREWSKVDTFSTLDKSGTASIDIDEMGRFTSGRGPVRVSQDRREHDDRFGGRQLLPLHRCGHIQSTGYDVSGIGADCVLQIDGWNGSRPVYLRFPSSRPMATA